jgi:hypothetical protein
VCLILHTVAVSKYTSNVEILFTAMCWKAEKKLRDFSGGHLIPPELRDTEYGT